MTSTLIEAIATQGVFRPRQKFRQLAEDHVPFDTLIGHDGYELAASRAIVDESVVVGIVGPRGAGKSSLIAYVCSKLPDTHVALRVPVSGADDPTSVSVMAAAALAQALADLELESYQREALERARADETTREEHPGRLGGTLGGGPVPAAVHAELATLREQLTSRRLAAERLAGLDRLIQILVSRGSNPVFVLEDTEAAIGGQRHDEIVSAFLRGPIHAFVHEIEASCLIAIQDVFTSKPEFAQLAASMALVEIPDLSEGQPRKALAAIIGNRLNQYELRAEPEEVLAPDGADLLLGFYDQSERSLRFTLAALQSAVEYAANAGADHIGVGHVRAAMSDWRARMSA